MTNAKKIGKSTKNMHNMAEIMKAMAHSDRLAILKLLCKNQPEGLTVKTEYEKLRLSYWIIPVREVLVVTIYGWKD